MQLDNLVTTTNTSVTIFRQMGNHLIFLPRWFNTDLSLNSLQNRKKRNSQGKKQQNFNLDKGSDRFCLLVTIEFDKYSEKNKRITVLVAPNSKSEKMIISLWPQTLLHLGFFSSIWTVNSIFVICWVKKCHFLFWCFHYQFLCIFSLLNRLVLWC